MDLNSSYHKLEKLHQQENKKPTTLNKGCVSAHSGGQFAYFFLFFFFNLSYYLVRQLMENKKPFENPFANVFI